MKINESHCYYCGVETDPENYQDIGNTTIWVCYDRLCKKELADDIKQFIADEQAQAEDERKNGWMSF